MVIVDGAQPARRIEADDFDPHADLGKALLHEGGEERDILAPGGGVKAQREAQAASATAMARLVEQAVRGRHIEGILRHSGRVVVGGD